MSDVMQTPLADWLAETRRLLGRQSKRWSDDALARYHREEFSPASAVMELRFRAMMAG